MNKANLGREIAMRAEINKYEADRMLDVMQEVIEECIERGEKVSLVGFLEIDSKEVQARDMTNPLTGEPVTCSPYTKPTVKFKQTFKNKIKELTRK